MIAALLPLLAAMQAAPAATPSAAASPASTLPPPVLSLKQLTLAVPRVESPERKALIDRFRAATRGITSCAAGDQVAREQGATVFDNDAFPIGKAPKPLQDILAVLPVGKASPLFGLPDQGMVRVVVLCARD